MPRTALRIGQFSAFYGDRDDGVRQLIDSGVDVLVGDYLAELTMLVLRKNQLRGRVGYAPTFLRQIGPHLDRIAEQGIKVVSNAGGLDPERCAEDLRALVREQGLSLRVAAVTGDDLLGDLAALRGAGETLTNLDTGAELKSGDHEILTANAYLGAWPIVEALRGGADIVVCPRVTDASVLMGPAIWHFGWSADDYDALAGALAAAHVIECGAQATGGQFSLFDRYPDLGLPGMPIAVVEVDGSSVLTKTSGTGGVVTTDTVTAQLLYEIGSPLYQNPDVVADFATCRIEQSGPDRVRLTGTRGYPPPDRLKVSLSYEGGYRNTATVCLTGGRIAAKLDWLRREVTRAVGPPDSFDDFRWTVVGPAATEDGSYDETTAVVVISAKSTTREKVGRAAFSNKVTQLAISNIPGYYLLGPPATEQMFGVYWPTTVAKAAVRPSVVFDDGRRVAVPWAPAGERPAVPPLTTGGGEGAVEPVGELVAVPLRDLVGTRSGDKGGNANVGVWAQRPELAGWLLDHLTVDEFRRLVPEADGLVVERYAFPNLGALNFVVRGFLDDGVASCLRLDAQAKGLGEYLGSRTVTVPRRILDASGQE